MKVILCNHPHCGHQAGGVCSSVGCPFRVLSEAASPEDLSALHQEQTERSQAYRDAGAKERTRLRIIRREKQIRIEEELRASERASEYKNQVKVEALSKKLKEREESRIALAGVCEDEQTKKDREFQDWQWKRKNNTGTDKHQRSSSTNIGEPTPALLSCDPNDIESFTPVGGNVMPSHRAGYWPIEEGTGDWR